MNVLINLAVSRQDKTCPCVGLVLVKISEVFFLHSFQTSLKMVIKTSKSRFSGFNKSPASRRQQKQDRKYVDFGNQIESEAAVAKWLKSSSSLADSPVEDGQEIVWDDSQSSNPKSNKSSNSRPSEPSIPQPSLTIKRAKVRLLPRLSFTDAPQKMGMETPSNGKKVLSSEKSSIVGKKLITKSMSNASSLSMPLSRPVSPRKKSRQQDVPNNNCAQFAPMLESSRDDTPSAKKLSTGFFADDCQRIIPEGIVTPGVSAETTSSSFKGSFKPVRSDNTKPRISREKRVEPPSVSKPSYYGDVPARADTDPAKPSDLVDHFQNIKLASAVYSSGSSKNSNSKNGKRKQSFDKIRAEEEAKKSKSFLLGSPAFERVKSVRNNKRRYTSSDESLNSETKRRPTKMRRLVEAFQTTLNVSSVGSSRGNGGNNKRGSNNFMIEKDGSNIDDARYSTPVPPKTFTLLPQNSTTSKLSTVSKQNTVRHKNSGQRATRRMLTTAARKKSTSFESEMSNSIVQQGTTSYDESGASAMSNTKSSTSSSSSMEDWPPHFLAFPCEITQPLSVESYEIVKKKKSKKKKTFKWPRLTFISE